MSLIHVVPFVAIYILQLVFSESRLSDSVEFSTCTGGCNSIDQNTCTVSAVRITPCTNGQMCNFVGGNDEHLSFDFIPNFKAQKLRTGIFYADGDYDIPVPAFDPNNACLYTTCPTVPGKKQTLEYTVHLFNNFPRGTFQFKWKLWNEENNQEVCCAMKTIKFV